LVVGADNLGRTERVLKQQLGVERIVHLTGRKSVRALPRTDLVLVYTGFANHGVVSRVKKHAKARGIRLVFVSRGLSELFEHDGFRHACETAGG
jgi:hypothetical protein